MEINVQMDIPTDVTEEQMQTLKETWENMDIILKIRQS